MKGLKKIKYLFGLMALGLMLCLLSFNFTACKKVDKSLTLDNYSKYINISAGAGSWIGDGYQWRRYTSYISISKKEGINLHNVTIKYTFYAPDLEDTFTESLNDLQVAYSKKIKFDFEYTRESINDPIPSPEVSIEVLEISGGISKQVDPQLTLCIIFLVVFAIIISITIMYHVRLSGKLARIEVGMTLADVILILGEPDITDFADDITTAIWQRWAGRGGKRNYCTLTLKNDIVISKID